MCGIAGRFLKDKKLEAGFRRLLAGILSPLSELAPVPAGFAIDGARSGGQLKPTRHRSQEIDFGRLFHRLHDAVGRSISHRAHDSRLAAAVLPGHKALPVFAAVTVVGSARGMELSADDPPTDSVREFTHAHDYLPLETNKTDWRVLNPRVKQATARTCAQITCAYSEPEDLLALNVEAAAMARVPLAGTDQIPGEERD